MIYFFYSLVILAKILLDVYDYSHMFNMEEPTVYVGLFFKIAWITGFLYHFSFFIFIYAKPLWVKIVISGVMFLFTHLFTVQLKYGTLTLTPYYFDLEQPTDFNFNSVLFTIPTSTSRQEIFFGWYNSIPYMPALEIYYGVNKNDITNATFKFKTERDKGGYAGYVGIQKGLAQNFLIKTPKKWIVIFEDDAMGTPWFRAGLARALTYYNDYDLIWFDTTNTLGWTLLRKVYSRLSIIAVKSNKTKELAIILDFNHPVFKKVSLSWTDDVPVYWFDILLAEYCNLKIIKCAHVPLGFHRGFKSSMNS